VKIFICKNEILRAAALRMTPPPRHSEVPKGPKNLLSPSRHSEGAMHPKNPRDPSPMLRITDNMHWRVMTQPQGEGENTITKN